VGTAVYGAGSIHAVIRYGLDIPNRN
jgi:hypothetical protein